MGHLIHLKDRISVSGRIQKAIAAMITSRIDLIAGVFCTFALFVAFVLSSFHQIGYFDVETDFYGNYAPSSPEFHLLYEGKNDHLLIYQIDY